MYRLFFIFTLSSLLFISCKGDDDSNFIEQEQDQEQDPDNFYALTVGNTWTYNYFQRIDRTDEFENLDVLSVVEIIGTSALSGEEYFVFQTTTSGNHGAPPYVPENGVVNLHFRDSLGYLINEAGIKFFSNTNPEEEYLVIEEPGFNIFGKLLNGTDTVEVEAGIFTALNNEMYAKREDGSSFPGRDRRYYADKIGQLKDTYSAVSDSLHIGEKRLLSYSVN